MNLQELRSLRSGEPGTLPSGLEVILKPVDLFDLVSHGEIPQDLHPAIERSMANSKKEQKGEMTFEETAQYIRLARAVAIAAIREPTDITADDLSTEDALSIFNHVSGRTKAQFGSFRSKQAGAVEPTPARNGVQPTAQFVPRA